MTDDWNRVRLADVATEVTVGHVGPMATEYVETGVPFLRSLNVDPFTVNLNDVKYIDREFHERLKKSALRPGDVVIVRTGKPGACAVIPAWLPEANCSDLVIVRCGECLDPRYLMYSVNSTVARHVNAHLVGAVQQHFNVGSARSIELQLPPIDEQRAIVGILGALDDKIELNRQMNRTLEELARAIFKSWFVDFDPVHAKAAGQQPIGTNAETAALFPDSFQDSPLGPIPSGWGIGSVEDVATVIYGAAFSSKLFSSEPIGKPLLRIRDLATHMPEVYTSEVHPKGHVVEPGDVIAGMDGEFRVHLWTGEQVWLNQRVCKFAPRPGTSELFVRLLMERPLNLFEQSKSGTTVIHLGKSDIDSIRFPLPPACVRDRYAALSDPLAAAIVANSQQSRKLAQTRDLLLPKLLSGEVRVAATTYQPSPV